MAKLEDVYARIVCLVSQKVFNNQDKWFHCEGEQNTDSQSPSARYSHWASATQSVKGMTSDRKTTVFKQEVHWLCLQCELSRCGRLRLSLTLIAELFCCIITVEVWSSTDEVSAGVNSGEGVQRVYPLVDCRQRVAEEGIMLGQPHQQKS